MRPLVIFCAEVPHINASISWCYWWMCVSFMTKVKVPIWQPRVLDRQRYKMYWTSDKMVTGNYSIWPAFCSWLLVVGLMIYVCVVPLPILIRCKFVSSMILKHFIFSRTHASTHTHAPNQTPIHPPPTPTHTHSTAQHNTTQHNTTQHNDCHFAGDIFKRISVNEII